MSSLVPRGPAPRSWCVIVVLFSLRTLASEPDCSAITRGNVVACAMGGSPLLAAELGASRAAEGRVEAARPLLPSNPVVTGSLGSRTGGASRTTNWSVTLAQELEIAGQSGLRVDTAHGELEAQRHQVAVVRADVAEQVWLAYFEVLAARERGALAARIERASAAVSLTVQAMAAQGLASSLEAAVADAAAVRATKTRLEAERDRGAGELRLRSLLGAPVTAEVAGTLEPLRPDAETGAARPERLALEALERASERRVELLRRSRAPNPTLSLFAQNDGFDEKVFGVGLGVPIPLPQPLGRTRAGEIAEAAGLEARLRAELEQVSRRIDSEQALARATWDTSVQARALYSPERLERARAGLTAIAEQLAAARIPVREALVSQQALVELLQAEVEARHELCVASVRLVRATGGSLEGGAL